MATRHELGQWGEHTLMGILSPLNARKADHHYGDIVVCDIICIEVKTARKTQESQEKYRFCLKTAESSTGHTNLWHKNNVVDFVCLIIVDPLGEKYFYLIPKGCIEPNKGHIVITSHPLKYKGRYSMYRISENDIPFVIQLYAAEKRIKNATME